MPNQGLNTGALKFILRYQINNPEWPFEKHEIPKFEKHFEWDINFYVGIQNITYTGNDVDIIEKYEGMYFTVYGINNMLSRNYRPIFINELVLNITFGKIIILE